MALNVEEQRINTTMAYLNNLKSVEDINADDINADDINADDINADDFIKQVIVKDNLDAEYIVNNNIFDILFDIYFVLNPSSVVIINLQKGEHILDSEWQKNSKRYNYYDILYDINEKYLDIINASKSNTSTTTLMMGVLTNFILNTSYYYSMLPDPGTSETELSIEVEPTYFIDEHNNLQKLYFILWKIVFTQLKDIFLSGELFDAKTLEIMLQTLANNISVFVSSNVDFIKIIYNIYNNFLVDFGENFTFRKPRPDKFNTTGTRSSLSSRREQNIIDIKTRRSNTFKTRRLQQPSVIVEGGRKRTRRIKKNKHKKTIKRKNKNKRKNKKTRKYRKGSK